MSKKSQFGMTLLLSTILVGGANASTVSTSNTLGATMIAQQGAVCKGVVKDAAIPNMPTEAQPGEPTKYAADLLLSRACLQAYAYTKKAEYLDKVIT